MPSNTLNDEKPKTNRKRKNQRIKGKGKGQIFKVPVIAYAVTKDSDEIRLDPIVAYGNRIDPADIYDELVTVIPAQCGTMAIYGVFDELPDEEVLLGYDIPGISSPDWIKVLNQTTYEAEDFELDNGETGKSMLFGFPNIEKLKQRS